MAEEELVMVIEKPHFIVKLHSRLLEVDLKRGVKKELEDVLEARPVLRENLGFLFQMIIPLDIPLRDIDSVDVDENGQVKIIIPLRRDIIIPLDSKESQRLVETLNELIPPEKQRYAKLLIEAEKAQRMMERAEAETISRTH